jgi:hypothetical protein
MPAITKHSKLFVMGAVPACQEAANRLMAKTVNQWAECRVAESQATQASADQSWRSSGTGSSSPSSPAPLSHIACKVPTPLSGSRPIRRERAERTSRLQQLPIGLKISCLRRLQLLFSSLLLQFAFYRCGFEIGVAHHQFIAAELVRLAFLTLGEDSAFSFLPTSFSRLLSRVSDSCEATKQALHNGGTRCRDATS